MKRKLSVSRTARLKRQLQYVLVTLWLAFGLTGVGLFWSGQLSRQELQTGIETLSRILISGMRLLIDERNGQGS